MDHADHVRLLLSGITGPGTWADLGAGSGAFTLALADLLGEGSVIYAIDRNARALDTNARAMGASFPEADVRFDAADFTQPMDLPALDGIVMANSLHFVADQAALVRGLRGYLGPGGRMLVVEYNISRPNTAVPHPVPYDRWQELAAGAGFEQTRFLARRPSSTFAEIYSAASE